MKKIILTILLIFTVSVVIYYANYRKHQFDNIPKAIMDTVFVMKNYPFVDFSVSDEPFIYQWKRQRNRCVWIYMNATNDEIEQLIEYPNSTIKAYAIYLLYHDKFDSSVFENKLIEKYKDIDVEVNSGGVIIIKTMEELINDFKDSGMEFQKVYKRKPLNKKAVI